MVVNYNELTNEELETILDEHDHKASPMDGCECYKIKEILIKRHEAGNDQPVWHLEKEV